MKMGRARFDDTPANGETRKGITSNWAYDHAHDPDAHGNDLYPWLIFINTFYTPKAQTGWSTRTGEASQLNGGYLQSVGNQNDNITWDIVLAKGTWTIELIHYKHTNRGIYSIQFDSVEKGTIDGYAGSGTVNTISSVSDIVVPTTAKIELKLKLATKNGLSSSYFGAINGIRLIRTA